MTDEQKLSYEEWKNEYSFTIQSMKKSFETYDLDNPEIHLEELLKNHYNYYLQND